MNNAMTSSMPLALRISPIVETLERIRLTAMISRGDWLDLIGIGWSEYQKLETGSASLSTTTYSTLEKVSNLFGLAPESLIENQIDYTSLALEHEPKIKLPEEYLVGAYGRRRTTINTINFVEHLAGWRLRLDIKRKFGLAENHLRDSFAPISIRLITEICGYLQRRSFQTDDFFAIGVDSYSANRDTIFGKALSEAQTKVEVIENFFNDCMNLLEQNCSYEIVRLGPEDAIIDMRSNSIVAEALGVRHLGSESLCQLKSGMVASLPLFIWQPMAKVVHTKCVHRGDEHCRFEVAFRHLPLVV